MSVFEHANNTKKQLENKGCQTEPIEENKQSIKVIEVGDIINQEQIRVSANLETNEVKEIRAFENRIKELSV